MSHLPRPAAVIFDMDGLLFDTEALYLDAIIGAAHDHGIALTQAVYLKTIGMSEAATRTYFADRFGSRFDFDAIWQTAFERFRQLSGDGVPLKPGVTELLDRLDSAGIPCGIATSSRHDATAHHLSVHDLADRFACVIAHGDYEHGKPHPAPYLTAAARLNRDPEACLALEDSLNGVRAASAAGMTTVMVPDLVAPTAEAEELCALIARDLHHVRDALDQAGLRT